MQCNMCRNDISHGWWVNLSTSIHHGRAHVSISSETFETLTENSLCWVSVGTQIVSCTWCATFTGLLSTGMWSYWYNIFLGEIWSQSQRAKDMDRLPENLWIPMSKYCMAKIWGLSTLMVRLVPRLKQFLIAYRTRWIQHRGTCAKFCRYWVHLLTLLILFNIDRWVLLLVDFAVLRSIWLTWTVPGGLQKLHGSGDSTNCSSSSGRSDLQCFDHCRTASNSADSVRKLGKWHGQICQHCQLHFWPANSYYQCKSQFGGEFRLFSLIAKLLWCARSWTRLAHPHRPRTCYLSRCLYGNRKVR